MMAYSRPGMFGFGRDHHDQAEVPAPAAARPPRGRAHRSATARFARSRPGFCPCWGT